MWFVNGMHQAGVDLPHRDHRPDRVARLSVARVFDPCTACPDGSEKQLPVAFHRFARVLGGDAQIQAAAAVGRSDAALPRAETVPQPVEGQEVAGLQRLDSVGLRWGFCPHQTILQADGGARQLANVSVQPVRSQRRWEPRL